jgi:hypothetical protein
LRRAGFGHFIICACLLNIGLPPAAADGLLGSTPAPNKAQGNADRPSPLPEPGSPSAVVKPFYDRYGLELDPTQRDHFIDPARKVLDGNDALKKSGQGDCLDQNMSLDNAVADRTEIEKTFRMLQSVNGDRAIVVVQFIEAGAPHRLEWKLAKVGDEWKISDLLSVTGEWALSQYQCQ